MFPTRTRILVGLLVLSFGPCFRGASAVPLNPVEEVARPIPFPDGVLDPARHTAFVSSPKGGIQAINLADGKILWTNDKCAAQPWLVAGHWLLARGDRIYVLDLKKEGKERACEALPYPKVTPPDRCGVVFRPWNPRVTDATLEANWYAVAMISRDKGRPFNFEGLTTFNRAAPAGTLKVNLESGRSEVQSDPKPLDLIATPMPEGTNAQQMPAGLSENLATVWQQYQKDQNGRITVLDGRLVGVALLLEKAGAAYRKKVVLNAWDLKTGAAAEPVGLVEGSAQDIANVALTEDRRHVAVQYSALMLSIYFLADGKMVAKEVKGVFSPEETFVEGKRLYHARGTGNHGDRNLTALDLESGKVAWEHPLKPRSTIPLPPGASK